MKKIIYMGTPDFAVPALEQLHAVADYDLKLVVTQPDKERNRGKKKLFSQVKTSALALGIDVAQPEKIKGNDEFINYVTDLSPDLIVVAAYGKILPKELLSIPKYGCINIHGSVLPKYRGAAPIHRAVIEGEEETGVTIMDMAVELDTGDMIAVAKTKIDGKTTEQLYEELSQLGAKLLLETIPNIFSGEVIKTAQNNDEATYAPMVFKEDGHLDFSKSPLALERLVRGVNSWPGAFALYGDKPMKIWESTVGQTTNIEGFMLGEIIKVSKMGIEVAAGGGTLIITKLQMPNKKAMEVSEFLKGNNIEIGKILI